MEANSEAYGLLGSLTCQRCVFMDWTRAFCHPPSAKDVVCDLYDKRSELAYFFDGDHLSLHGALKMLPYLRDLKSNYRKILDENRRNLYFARVP